MNSINRRSVLLAGLGAAGAGALAACGNSASTPALVTPSGSQVARAEEMARKIGVDLLRFIPVGMPYDTCDRQAVKDEWYPVTMEGRAYSSDVEQQFGQANKPSPCFYLYRTMVVHPDGGVAPCCVVYKESSDFGRFPAEAMSLWNNDHYQSARALFSHQTAPVQQPTICDGCEIFEKHPSKALVDQLAKSQWGMASLR